MAHSRCTITWEDALEDDRVQTLEDPLHKTATAKDVYDRLYGESLGLHALTPRVSRRQSTLMRCSGGRASVALRRGVAPAHGVQ
jgi:hypothetical protein